MITFAFKGLVNHLADLEYKKADIGDCYHVMYSGSKNDTVFNVLNSTYCFTGNGWENIEAECADEIVYVVETFVKLGKYKYRSRHANFETDTIVVLAEYNKTKATIEVLNLWPEILNEPDIKWEVSDSLHHCIDVGKCFMGDGICASIEYTSRINEIMKNRKESDSMFPYNSED